MYGTSPEYGQSANLVDWDRSLLETLPMLDSQTTIALAQIAINQSVYRLKESQSVEIDSTLTPQILITGMPKLGKSTTIQAVSEELYRIGIPHKVVTERQPTFQKDFGDETGSFFYNMAISNFGLANLAADFHNSPLTLYDKGLVDHIVFARALKRLYEDKYTTNAYAQYVDIYSKYLGLFLPLICGVVVCNSSAKTSVKSGSKLPEELLDLVSQEFNAFPRILSEMKETPFPEAVTINIDFDSVNNPHEFLKRAINTLIKWNAEGKIET